MYGATRPRPKKTNIVRSRGGCGPCRNMRRKVGATHSTSRCVTRGHRLLLPGPVDQARHTCNRSLLLRVYLCSATRANPTACAAKEAGRHAGTGAQIFDGSMLHHGRRLSRSGLVGRMSRSILSRLPNQRARQTLHRPILRRLEGEMVPYPRAANPPPWGFHPQMVLTTVTN